MERLYNVKVSQRQVPFMEDILKARNDEESNGTSEKYVTIRRSGDIQELMQCPICLGILRNTRTVMECLHRFCRECIDKAMRLGKNECPTCRTHCASRRSLRDDPQFDALIAAIYPDLEAIDEKEFTLLEENVAKNKQTQKRIAEAFKRQAEALARFKRPKPVAIKTRVGVSNSKRAEFEVWRPRVSGQSCSFPDLNKNAVESSNKTLNQLHPAQEGGGRELSKARVNIVSRRADLEDEGLNDIRKNFNFPDLNTYEAELSVAMTLNQICPAEEGGDKYSLHGLQLLCDLADLAETSKINDHDVAAEVTEIKDNELTERADVENWSPKKRKRGPGGTMHNDSSSAASTEDSVPVHMASVDICEGRTKEVLLCPTGNRSLGTAKRDGLLLLESVSNNGECLHLEKEKEATEETESRQEVENNHDHLVAYERGLSTCERGQGKAQTQTVKCGTRKQTKSASTAKARPSKRGTLCARAAALFDHLVATAHDEREDEFDLQLRVKPRVDHSDSDHALPGLEQPYLCCPSRMKIQQLCEYLANKIPVLRGRNIEILVSTSSYQMEASGLQQPESTQEREIVLQVEYTLNYVWSNLWHKRGNMVLLYREVESHHEDMLEKVPTQSGRRPSH